MSEQKVALRRRGVARKATPAAAPIGRAGGDGGVPGGPVARKVGSSAGQHAGIGPTSEVPSAA